MSQDPMQFIRVCNSTGEVYAAAYGYLQAVVDEYIHGVINFQHLVEDYVVLQTACAEELSRIMENHKRQARENLTVQASVTLTTDIEEAKKLQEEYPDTIILDAR